MSSNIKKFLTQLKKDELLDLAKTKKIRLQPTLSKPKMVEILSYSITQNDINHLLSKTGRFGKKAVIDGANYEKKISKIFEKQGYECTLNYKRIRGMEFDIIGTGVEKGWLSSKYYFIAVECKNKPKVIMNDFSKFLGKFQHIKAKYEAEGYQCHGYMYTSGLFDPVVKKTCTHHKDISLKIIKA